jgi:hypothetical protein
MVVDGVVPNNTLELRTGKQWMACYSKVKQLCNVHIYGNGNIEHVFTTPNDKCFYHPREKI